MSWLNSFKKPKLSPVEEYSVRIFKAAAEGVDAIRQLSEDRSVESERYGLTHTEWFCVFNEFQYFYLHLTDRFAFGNIDESLRGKTLSELEDWAIDRSVETICKDWPPEKIENIKKESKANFLVSMQDYAQYKKWFPEKGAGTGGTLFWEFGKQIANLAGRGLDIVYIMTAVELATNAMKTLDIQGFIGKIK
jgi:hypothetical protein